MGSREYFNRRRAGAFTGLALLTLLLLPAGASAKAAATASIIGGNGATIEEFPSLAYIQVREGKSSFACTGTVVAPRVILTAAHCIQSPETGNFASPGNYAVATGTTAPGKALRQNVFGVAETHVFPDFDPGGLSGDAGILVLDRPTAAPPIALAGPADAALFGTGATVQLAGWGVTRVSAPNGPDSLRSTSVVVQAHPFCRQKTRPYYNSYSPAKQICVLDAPDRKSIGCFGDSGGPAIGRRADGALVEVGILSSSGPFCNTRLPNVLTRADFVGPWVAEWIAAIETGAPRPTFDPRAPFPLMTRPIAEAFTVSTLGNAFGGRFERAAQLLGRCVRAGRSRFQCEVFWRSGPDVYRGVVSPFYVHRQQTVTWDSRFRVEWASLKCLRSDAPRCPIRTKRG